MRTSDVRRLAAAVAALTVTVLPGLVAPAHAASQEDCGADKFCVWSEPGHEGQFRRASGRASGCVLSETGWPDGTKSTVRSLYNRTRFQVEWYANDSCSGAPTGTITPGSKVQEVESEFKSFRLTPICEQGAVCFYSGADYTGQVVKDSSWNLGFCTSSGIPAKSVYNATEHPVALFDTNGSCQNARAVDLPARSYGSYDQTFYGFRVKPR
ncbi:peptidase inhibitor family I36 protein [Streptomyces sp. NEAU-Y11]|uniref:peptidase inhibitor family I36 protein n=1 Tax=Streptomyces cucumeris TaxID=2962890 RepID=UPI0020C928B8|nr:peptidase inhibitor family I36 protein [Streptomyces sp. NEAU-Y11]MCP9211165.1 peptidase inhibitor family I36 protein [Streptomyces sp. NEAU-Y11]